jgi:hypothetical protein
VAASSSSPTVSSRSTANARARVPGARGGGEDTTRFARGTFGILGHLVLPPIGTPRTRAGRELHDAGPAARRAAGIPHGASVDAILRRAPDTAAVASYPFTDDRVSRANERTRTEARDGTPARF